jgi:hypothetical protein
MLEDVQIIKDKDEAKFAVISFEEYLVIKELLTNEEKLEDYLDYLHMQRVKERTQKMYTLEEVKQELSLDSDA